MYDMNKLNQTLQDSLAVFQDRQLSKEEAAIVWGGVGQVIFGGGALHSSDVAYELMIQYLQNKCRGPVPSLTPAGFQPNKLGRLQGFVRRLLG